MADKQCGLWITHGPRAMRPFPLAVLYSNARQRVLSSPRLSPYMDIILSDGYSDDDAHLTWVIRAKVAEIEGWAQQIKEDSDG